MNTSNILISQLVSLRIRFGKQAASEKVKLLNAIDLKAVKNKKALQNLYSVLLFLIAYPDNQTVSQLANKILLQLQKHIQDDEDLQYMLYNTGITGSSVCAAFSFDMVKWLRKTRCSEINFDSFQADDAQIQSILSVVIPKVESEILQDGNADWKGWFRQFKKSDEDLLDQLIAVFDSSEIRPEVKDELWNTIGINVEIKFASSCSLPDSLTKPYYHRSLIRKLVKKEEESFKPSVVKLTENEAEQIIDCSRMILVRHLREIDPTSFTAPNFVSYYQLPRGYSIALMSMVPERRHPIDSYMSYTVFKNGLPVSYGGSWLLFDSGRIGFNVFPAYRGAESKYIFDQVLQLHRRVYRLKRFTADPYQVGKENSDGIHSGAFWIYYHAGFRPLQKEQQELAAAEELKIKNNKKYRSPEPVLKILANCRQELVLQKAAVRFDATDISRAYAGILRKKYNGDRLRAEKNAVKKMAKMLQIKNYQSDNMLFILKNWAALLLCNEKELLTNRELKKWLTKIFILKSAGSEAAYHQELQKAIELRKYLKKLVMEGRAYVYSHILSQ